MNRASTIPTIPGKLQTIPAPTGGWNARDNLAEMDEKDAILIDNFFPTPSDVMLAKGYTNHLTGSVLGQVESLMAYSSDTGVERLYAASGTAIYNATESSATASAAATGFTNVRFQHINFTNSSGTSYLLFVNGADTYRAFDGSSFSAPSISGVSANAVNNIWQHKRRVWFTENNTLKAWFLNVDAISGTASAVDLSGFMRKGGSLRAGGTWTLDAGEGVDDYWVAVSSEGEVIVYKGTDPSSASTWEMVGRWELGKPIGRRVFCKYAGDLLYVAEDGVWPLSRALISDRVDPRVAMTDKITQAMNDAAMLYSSNFGWEIEFYQAGPMIVLNVPVNEGSGQHQYVMNTISKAWGRFRHWAANCFEIYQGDLYFGGNGLVAKAWDGFSANGANIDGDCKQAFNYFRVGHQLKQWTLARPIFSSNGTPAVSMSLNVDYDDTAPSGTLSFTPISYSTWDSAVWDVGVWGGGLSVLRNWQTVSGIGFCAAPRLKVAASGIEVRWACTDFVFKQGGIVG